MLISSDVKQKIVGVTTLFVIFAILGTVFILERSQPPNLAAYERQTQKIFESAKEQFEHMRNVTLPPDIKLSIYTKQQAIDRWGKERSELDIANIRRQENIYKGLFLIVEEDSLSGNTDEWISNWMAVSVGNEIYVIYENFQPWDILNAEATLIHELTHIWQPSLPAPTNYDTDRAYTALIEGDASYMSDHYRVRHGNNTSFGGLNYNHSLSDFTYNPQMSLVYTSIPNSITELNIFPYIKGKTFVSTLVNDDCWNKLNRCYTPEYMPSTTAQILHPDKYFTGETAKPTHTPKPNDDNWTIIPNKYGYHSDTYGEHFIYVILGRWLNDTQAQETATGWSGDSFTYYEKNQDFLFAWNITWNSKQDAAEFNQAFTTMLNFTQANVQGNNIWFTNSRYLTITCNPNTQSTLILCSTDPTAINPTFFT